MARSEKVRLSFVEESTHGTTPSPGALEMIPVEFNGQTFDVDAPKAQSEIIRTDSRLRSVVSLNRSASGGFSADMTYPTVNEGLFYLLRAGWNSSETAVATNANTCAIAASGTTITRGAGSFVTDGFTVGDIVKVSNASSAADNRFVVVTTVAALTLTVQIPDSGTWAGTDADVTVTRGARMIDNAGSTERAFSFEVANLDLQKMGVFAGQRVNAIDFGFAMGQKSTISIGCVGRSGTYSAMASATVGITGATGYTAPTRTPIFGPAASILVVVNGDVFPVRDMSIATTRNMRIGHSTEGGATPDRVQAGLFGASMRFSAYYDVVSALNDSISGAEVPIWVVMSDGGTKSMSFSAGTAVYASASKPTRSMNQDEMVEASLILSHNSTRDDVFRFQRFE